jgi:hypothetical protein
MKTNKTKKVFRWLISIILFYVFIKFVMPLVLGGNGYKPYKNYIAPDNTFSVDYPANCTVKSKLTPGGNAMAYTFKTLHRAYWL